MKMLIKRTLIKETSTHAATTDITEKSIDSLGIKHAHSISYWKEVFELMWGKAQRKIFFEFFRTFHSKMQILH